MASVTCPFCGSEISYRQFWATANKPFCPNCGWNLNRAHEDVSGKAKTVGLLLTVCGIAVAVTAGMALYKNDFPGFLPIPVLLCVISFGYAWEYRASKIALSKVLLAGKTDPSISGRTPLPSPFIEKVQALPRPRRVKLRLTGQASMLLLILGLGIVGALIFVVAKNARGGSFSWNELWSLLPLLVIVLILAVVMIITIAKERRKFLLFRDGEVSAARVVGQQVIQRGKHSYNEITYEFASPGGHADSEDRAR